MTLEPQSINAISKLTGVSHARCTEMLLGVREAGMRAGHPVFDLADALPAIVAGLQNPTDPAQLSARARRDHWAAARAELALNREKREVLPVAAIAHGIARAYAVVRSSLDSVPDHLERKAGISPAAAEVARDIVDGALSDLANKMQALYESEGRLAPDELAAQGRELLAADRGDANISDLL